MTVFATARLTRALLDMAPSYVKAAPSSPHVATPPKPKANLSGSVQESIEHVRPERKACDAASAGLVQRHVPPAGRVRRSCLATSLLRTKSQPPRCKEG